MTKAGITCLIASISFFFLVAGNGYTDDLVGAKVCKGCLAGKQKNQKPLSDSVVKSLLLIKKSLSCKWMNFHGQKHLDQGHVPPFGMQELIGADLAKMRMQDFSRTRGTVKSTNIGILASAFTKSNVHAPIAKNALFDPKTLQRAKSNLPYTSGTGLANFIAAKGSKARSAISTATHTKLSAVIVPTATTNYQGLQTADILSVEPGLMKSREQQKELATLSKTKILVTAPSTNYPKPAKHYEANFPGITVGSISTGGIPDSNTPDGIDLTILVPDHGFAQTIYNGSKIEPTRKSGLAGTGLVTGTLANTKSILGSLTQEEAKFLLQKTALPSLHTGTLNSLRLIEVARRLKTNGWPKNRKQLLKTASLFRFKTESQAAVKKAAAKMNSKSCKNQKEGFALLRKSYLLDPNETARKLLQHHYKAMGFSRMAKFYESLNPSPKAREAYIKKQLHSIGISTSDKLLFLRAARSLPKNRQVSLFKQYMQTSQTTDAEELQLMMGAANLLSQNPSQRAFVLQTLKNQTSFFRKPIPGLATNTPYFLAISALSRIRPQGLNYIEKFFSLKDNEIKIALAQRGSELAKDSKTHVPALALLDRIASVPSLRVKKELLASIRPLGKTALPVLLTLSQDRSIDIQLGILDTIQKLGKEKLSLLEKTVFHTDSNVMNGSLMQIEMLGTNALPLMKSIVFKTSRNDLKLEILTIIDRQSPSLKWIRFLKTIQRDTSLDPSIRDRADTMQRHFSNRLGVKQAPKSTPVKQSKKE